MTVAEATTRAEAARRYAASHGLRYVPCVAKRPDGTFDPTPLDAPDALKLLMRVGHVPADVVARWWTGERLDELKLSLCTQCACNPIANDAGTCWWCERSPYVCSPSAVAGA